MAVIRLLDGRGIGPADAGSPCGEQVLGTSVRTRTTMAGPLRFVVVLFRAPRLPKMQYTHPGSYTPFSRELRQGRYGRSTRAEHSAVSPRPHRRDFARVG